MCSHFRTTINSVLSKPNKTGKNILINLQDSKLLGHAQIFLTSLNIKDPRQRLEFLLVACMLVSSFSTLYVKRDKYLLFCSVKPNAYLSYFLDLILGPYQKLFAYIEEAQWNLLLKKSDIKMASRERKFPNLNYYTSLRNPFSFSSHESVF